MSCELDNRLYFRHLSAEGGEAVRLNMTALMFPGCFGREKAPEMPFLNVKLKLKNVRS